MKQVNYYSKLFFIATALWLVNDVAIAQCQATVREAINKLSPFSFNGQVNNVSLKAGKQAELHLAFYKGYTYKIQVLAEEQHNARVSFKVLDANHKEIYNSNTGTQTDSWTFYSNSPQELIVVVSTTEKSKHCAVVLVGVQIPKNDNSIRYL